MKKLLLVTVLVLSGCASTSVPVVPAFPAVPEDMMKPCPELGLVDPATTKLSSAVDTVVNNYGLYQDCKNQVDDWIDWYNTQKTIYGKIK
jgi:hypothetical protein